MKASADRPATPYIATNLAVHWPAGDGPDYPDDLTVEGLPYRRLAPPYYAWLRSRMEKVRGAWQSGKLDEASYAALRDKFNVVHDQAVRLFGEPALLDAVRSLDPRTYPAPTRCGEDTPRIPGTGATGRQEEGSGMAAAGQGEPTRTNQGAGGAVERPVDRPVAPADLSPDYRFPEAEDPALPHHWRVRTSALLKVQAIEQAALAAGWSTTALYQNRGRFTWPYGGDYGLVCFIDPEERIGMVTAETIELICPGGHFLHFRKVHRRASA